MKRVGLHEVTTMTFILIIFAALLPKWHKVIEYCLQSAFSSEPDSTAASFGFLVELVRGSDARELLMCLHQLLSLLKSSLNSGLSA